MKTMLERGPFHSIVAGGETTKPVVICSLFAATPSAEAVAKDKQYRGNYGRSRVCQGTPVDVGHH